MTAARTVSPHAARRVALSLAVAAALAAAPTGGAQAPNAQAPDGAKIYSTTCASCHQANGLGTEGTYPPLGGSEWATEGEGRIVRILLHGLTGEVEVAGETYSGLMPPWGGALKDAELAAVASYVRASFGNRAAPITAATVARLRAATAGRTRPWTAAELAGVK